MTRGQEDAVGSRLEDVIVGILGTASQEEVQQYQVSLQCYLYPVLPTVLLSEEGSLSAFLHY